jgi:hypothetical protein
MWIGVKPNEGKKFAYDTRQHQWIEYTADGYLFAFFDTVEVTPDYIHILDRKRNLGLRLYSDHCDFSSTNNFEAECNRLWDGYWASDPFGELAVGARPDANPQRPIIMMPAKQRDFVPPDTVGVPKDCPFPTVRKPIKFLCPKCGLRGETHVLYPHLPWCPKDGTVMNEVE